MEKSPSFRWMTLFVYEQVKKGRKPSFKLKGGHTMRSTKWSKRIVVQGLLTAMVGMSGKAYADAKWYDGIGLSGYLQSSYVANLNSPHDGAGAKHGGQAGQRRASV